MRHTLTEKDQGKRVVDSTGDKVGMISKVKSGTAYVDPDPNLAEKILSRFDWGDIDDDNYPLRDSDIATVTDDEVRLKG